MVLTRPDHSNKQSGKDDMSECHQHKKSFKYFKSLYNKTYSGLSKIFAYFDISSIMLLTVVFLSNSS